ncbi:MAG: glycosyltransferase family 2 protein [Sphingobacteriaceae bacterium]|nr:glycosyltransferase family 2 protein [Sphingobacteriaceae bacterium]
MSQLPISVIIIAKNEEHNLPRCLNSLRGWVSEIIAVLNDCHDKSEEILLSVGAKVYQHEWQGFVKQKNIALNYASNNWIFSIDADEEVTPAMRNEIEGIVNSESEAGISGVSFCRKTWLLGRWIKHGDWYPDRVIRLFKKDCSQFEGNYLHEKLVVKGRVLKSKTNLLHYSFPSMYLFLSKNDSFTRAFITANLGRKNFSVTGTVLRSFWKFFRGYFIKLGFMDGYPGFIIAVQQAYSTFFRYNMLLEYRLQERLFYLDKEDE